MKRITKVLGAAVATALLAGALAPVAMADVPSGWVKESDGWHYYVVNANNTESADLVGTMTYIDGKLYRFNAAGVMQTGWQSSGGEDFYFGSNGAGYNGWVKAPDGVHWCYCSDGFATTSQLFTIGGKLYYFDASGYMATGWQRYDGVWYYFDSNGAGHTGWVKSPDGAHWMYTLEGEAYEDMTAEINGVTYGFDEDGYMMTGWVEGIFDWYLFDSNGAGHNGWVKAQDQVHWRYCKDGTACTDTVAHINGSWYGFDNEGYMRAGWYEDSDGLYYFDLVSGKGYTGFHEVDGEWYYFNEDAIAADWSFGTDTCGWKKVDGRWCFFYAGQPSMNQLLYDNGSYYGFDENGFMITGWYNWGTTDYPGWGYYESNGKARTGWHKDNAGWRYYQLDGTYYHGDEFEINGKYYYFNANGVMQTGWVKVHYYEGDHWIYYDSNGAAYTGWVKSNGKWCYCEDGWMLAGETQVIGGARYIFDENGYMLTGWQEEDDGYYSLFDSNGKAMNGWIKDGDYWRYYEDGRPYVDDIYMIDGVLYGFDENGHMLRNHWMYGDIYYIGSNGIVVTGWNIVENLFRFFYTDGMMAKSFWLPNGVEGIWLDENGRVSFPKG